MKNIEEKQRLANQIQDGKVSGKKSGQERRGVEEGGGGGGLGRGHSM